MTSHRLSGGFRACLAGMVAVLVLASCGFRPLYSEGAPSRDIHGAFSIEDSGDAFAFVMRERLRTRIGVGDPARYKLILTTEIDEEERAIRADRSILRFNLEGVTIFTVRSAQGGKVLFSDRATTFTAYSAIASPFATREAREDALARLATDLADKIVLRLAATAGDWME